MGVGASSRAYANFVNNIAISSVQENVQECVTEADQTLNINIKQRGIAIADIGKVKQNISVDAKCLMDAKKIDKIANDLTNAITQNVSAQSTSLISALNKVDADAETNISNNISTSLTQKNMQKTMTDINQAINMNVDQGGFAYFKATSIEQGATAVAESIVRSEAVAEVVNKISNKLAQESSAVSDLGIGAVMEAFFQSFAAVIIVVIVVVLLGGAGFLFFSYKMTGGNLSTLASVFTGGPSDDGDDYYDEEPEYRR